ncbi:MAG: peptide chain release factor 1 [Candidatus Lightella neohaematopini]|nr:peptide chain release factor 1 [Candidatus Lightella neohaematopini]MCV2529014.1 peptide chain release factor 1 [Candidatus Lightella neohaematopini]
MNKNLITELHNKKLRFNEVKILLSKKSVISNKKLFLSLSKEYNKLIKIVEYFNQWLDINKNIYNTKKLINNIELKDLVTEELQLCKKNRLIIEKKIVDILYSKENISQYGCFLEIRAGTGGNEASLFASDLLHMYSQFSNSKNWHIEIINTNYNYSGGYKEIIIRVNNKEAYNYLMFESGGHRVQRIPMTESQGRIHTSTCTVAVMPVVQESKIIINNNDLRIDSFRSSGAGGQHVNTTNSAIRIIHIPTGITVECQDERSQHKNKAKAMSVLIARLNNLKLKEKQKKETLIRRTLLGSGDRSDRIRTYNFPQRRVTDHRINFTLYRLEDIFNGKLDLIIQPLINYYSNR